MTRLHIPPKRNKIIEKKKKKKLIHCSLLGTATHKAQRHMTRTSPHPITI